MRYNLQGIFEKKVVCLFVQKELFLLVAGSWIELDRITDFSILRYEGP